MTPLENIIATIHFENPKRIPVTMLETEHAIKLSGTTYREFATKPEVLSKALIKSVRRYAYDWIWVYVSDWIEFECLGAKMEYENVIPPRCVEFAVKDDTDVYGLDAPDPWQDGKMPVILSGIERMKNKVGSEIMLCGRVACPFSSAILMRGIERGFADLYRRQEVFHKMMDLGLETAISFGKAQLEAGAHGLWVGDVFASSRFISKKRFQELAFPYEKKLIDEIRKMGGVSFIFHDETNVNRLIEEAKVGADVVGIGNDTDLAEVRIVLGEDFCLSGNVDPVRVLLQGSPKEVTKTVKKCIQDAGMNGGFILNTGECVCRDTPPKNLDAFVQAVHEADPI
ncbi:uroporphyrinogen decarboxylase family protein [[Eubacterium] cellulosolvens]